MAVLASGLMGAILLVFFLYISLHPEKIRRRGYFILGWGGLKLIVLSGLFVILHVSYVAQLLGWLGLMAALGGAGGAVFPGPLPILESAEPKADAPKASNTEAGSPQE